MISVPNPPRRSSGSRAILYLLSKSKSECERVCHLPVIQTRYYSANVEPGGFDALVLTSKEAVNALVKSGVDLRGLSALCVSCKTAQKAKAAGMHILDFAGGYGRQLGTLILRRYSHLRLFFPHGKTLAFDLPGMLHEAAVACTEAVVYETVCAPAQTVDFENNSVFIFTSPSTVRCFFQNYSWRPGFKAVAIGQTTLDALPKECEAFMAESTDISACIDKGLQL
ncbi:MAG: uroporphyrinogen-III synthase [Campylobacterota bacterium]